MSAVQTKHMKQLSLKTKLSFWVVLIILVLGILASCGAATACLDMSTPLAVYLKSIPIDPQGAAATTGYSVVVDANNIVTITACNAENSETIQVSR